MNEVRTTLALISHDDYVFSLTGYYHELMLRGHSHLCQFMPRCRDARRLSADPDNEPDFYCINQIVGAPDSKGPVSRPATPPKCFPTPPMNFIQYSTYTTSGRSPVQQQPIAPRMPSTEVSKVVQQQPDDGNMAMRLALAALVLQQLQNEAAH